nr:ATP-binding cassette domain-containing protein [Solirubrobacterales bacterium]
MLELNEVVKRYSSASEDVRAVDRVSLRVEGGEMVSLQGPSGSGKTTLLLLAACALRADGGSVRYQGRDLGSLSEQQAAQYRLGEVGLIGQGTHLMARVPAVENAATKLLLGGVALPEARRRAGEWLERVGLAEGAGDRIEALSLGNRQRVQLAAALVH